MANFEYIKGKTLKWEGELSNRTDDNASRNPSPCTYDGTKGWHTNKGVTWGTFVDSARVLGYEPNCDNFIKMPQGIWYNIAKKQFWDSLNLDNLKSNGVAFQLFSWHWGAGKGWFNRMQRYLTSKGISWNQKASTLADAINQVIDKQGEKQTIDDLDAQQKEFYKSLNQPANIRGWLNRIEDTTKYAYSYIGQKISKVYSENKKNINYTLIGVGLIALSFFAWKQYKKFNK